MTDTLPEEWSTPRCWARDSVADEAPELARLYNSCSALGAVDPTSALAWCEEVWLKVYACNERALRH